MNGQLPPNCPPPPDGLPSYMGVKKDLPPKQADLIQEPTMVQGGDPQQLAEMPDLGKGKSKYQPKKCEHNRIKSRCVDCGGKGICEHKRIRRQCKECGGTSICEHKRQRSSCKECKGTDPLRGGTALCPHGRQKSRCKEGSCCGTGICSHGRQRRNCKDCVSSTLCEHDKQKGTCKECTSLPDDTPVVQDAVAMIGGQAMCEHGRGRSRCKQCGGKSICEHNRRKNQCKDCGGSSICPHKRFKPYCRDCKGSAICAHDKLKSRCKECGGSALCEHLRRKSRCKDCNPAISSQDAVAGRGGVRRVSGGAGLVETMQPSVAVPHYSHRNTEVMGALWRGGSNVAPASLLAPSSHSLQPHVMGLAQDRTSAGGGGGRVEGAGVVGTAMPAPQSMALVEVGGVGLVAPTAYAARIDIPHDQNAAAAHAAADAADRPAGGGGKKLKTNQARAVWQQVPGRDTVGAALSSKEQPPSPAAAASSAVASGIFGDLGLQGGGVVGVVGMVGTATLGEAALRYCEHKLQLYDCPECFAKSLCEHNRTRKECLECKKSICDHKKERSMCKDCKASLACEHNLPKAQCKVCNFCEHNNIRSECRQCDGTTICEHNRDRKVCKTCRGGALCEHNRERRRCVDCGGPGICEHRRIKRQCKDCGGTSICEHKKQRSHCRTCKGSSFCTHGRERYRCKECQGSGICAHNRARRDCKECISTGVLGHGERVEMLEPFGGAAGGSLPGVGSLAMGAEMSTALDGSAAAADLKKNGASQSMAIAGVEELLPVFAPAAGVLLATAMTSVLEPLKDLSMDVSCSVTVQPPQPLDSSFSMIPSLSSSAPYVVPAPDVAAIIGGPTGGVEEEEGHEETHVDIEANADRVQYHQQTATSENALAADECGDTVVLDTDTAAAAEMSESADMAAEGHIESANVSVAMLVDESDGGAAPPLHPEVPHAEGMHLHGGEEDGHELAVEGEGENENEVMGGPPREDADGEGAGDVTEL